MGEMADLPSDILLDIFSRVPTKCAGKCKCLSKSWRIRLSTPQFINQHLKFRKIHNQENKTIFVINPTDKTLCIITPLLKNNCSVVPRQIQWPPGTLWLHVIGSCNGLVLLKTNNHVMFLVNPVTLQQVDVPYSRKSDTVYVFGFGYDPSCDDYKVVKLVWPGGENFESLSVYSVRRRAWKDVENVPCHLIPTHAYYPMAFVNGAVHWLTVIEGRCVVVGFHLEHEVFREIAFSNDFGQLRRTGIFVLGGCMCIISHDVSNCTIDMRMMKEYGIMDSWVKYRIQTNARGRMLQPLCSVKDGEFLYLNNEGRWILHNLKGQAAKDVVVGGVSGYLTGVGAFVDSLVSLDEYALSS